MDSPYPQSQPADLQRMRSESNLSVQSIDSRGAIRKRSLSRSRPLSSTQAERLHQYALEQASQVDSISSFTPNSLGNSWITPQHSPQPQVFSAPGSEPFPQWTVPTPPHSDSGVPSVSIDVNEEPTTTTIGTSADFAFTQAATSAEMSSLGFLLPSQYGSGAIESEPNSYTMEQNYIPSMRMSQPASTSGAGAYSQPSHSPGLYQSRTMPDASASRRHSEYPGEGNAGSPYQQNYRRISSPYETMHSNGYPMHTGQTIPSISGLTQSPIPSPHLASSADSAGLSHYHTSLSRSPNPYDPGMYSQSYTSNPAGPPMYASSQSMSYPPPFVGSSTGEPQSKSLGSDNASIRVLNQRPKPQCWEHGCNGRQFSTFSNLLRHQREKSGTASKSYCPKCGAEFTRTTARNGHLAHDKCTKQRGSEEE